MKIIINEKQYRILQELSSKSEGVQEFIQHVEETPGLLKHLGFKNMKALKDYITDGDNDDLDELKDDAKKFKKEK